MPFSALGLSPSLCRAAAELGFSTPTPIQHEAIPRILAGSDLRGCAQTGSGKTVAFALPLLQHLDDGGAPTPRRLRALVLVPTRELAVQVGDVLLGLARTLAQPPRVAVVFGGVSVNPQMMGLRGGADVVVATPGRLLDLAERRALSLAQVDFLVLDEADRLLDLGFADELAKVMALLPPSSGAVPDGISPLGKPHRTRQTVLFSATFPKAVQALADALLHQPASVDIAASPATTPGIVQRAIRVDPARRTQLLRHLIQHHGWQRTLVFVGTRHASEIVAAKLYKAGIFATAFHGELSQGTRQAVLQELKDERWEVVVTTDLASRGIDIPQLPVVVNYDLPRSPVDYVHRIGRTGRAGENGVAISFVSAASEAHLALIEKRQGLAMAREVVPGFEPTETPVPQDPQASVGGIKGRRPSKKDKLRAEAARLQADPGQGLG